MNDLNSLVDEAAKSVGVEVPPVNSSANKSKSARVREYLAKHPSAKNKDIAAALAKYSVTAADVGNVKTQLRKKAAKQSSTAAEKSPAAADKSAPAAASAKKEVVIDVSIGLDVLDAGIEFVNKAGGLNEAQYALNVIRRIKSL